MHHTFLELPIVLPVLFWALYHYYKDRRLPEPIGRLAVAFFLGMGSAWLAGLMYAGLDIVNLRFDAYQLAETNLPGLLAYAILAIGLLEELAKFVPFMLVITRFKEFDEPLDGIIYGSFIALGFAAVENAQYLQYVSTAEAYARGFAGTAVHIVFASIWGYYTGRALLCGRNPWPAITASLSFTALLHGIYDFVVIALPSPALLIAALIIVGTWLWRLYLIRDLHNMPPGPCPFDEVPDTAGSDDSA
jgi:RsiW-degrading membrane proteinase PrsW (M82 family)